jgi:hypothetical protein
MEKLQPERVSEMLKKKGVEISVEQAALVLEFMRKLASIVVANHLDRKKITMNRLTQETNGDINPDGYEDGYSVKKKVPEEDEMEIKWMLA